MTVRALDQQIRSDPIRPACCCCCCCCCRLGPVCDSRVLLRPCDSRVFSAPLPRRAPQHAKLLNEALQLQKLVRERMHRLTSNTLPKAIVKAIGRGELDFVNTYQKCTVMQSDMVGFTALSAKYPPQRVLGILSDIFEEFDRLCEEHNCDKIKTIGDACAACPLPSRAADAAALSSS